MVKCQGCASYVGVDTADHALAELQRRADETGMHAVTMCMDAAEIPVMRCDLALCNFAIHYFCDSRQHADQLLSKISKCLRPAGAFTGTYQRWPDESSIQFGQAHHAVVGDCVDAVEWRVPFHDIQAIALKYGLALVYHQPLQILDQNADSTIWGFIMIQQTAQHCGTPEKESRKPDALPRC